MPEVATPSTLLAAMIEPRSSAWKYRLSSVQIDQLPPDRL
jgi:hypothetical protein